MKDVLRALDDKRLHCVFGTGTACVISPVAQLFYKNKTHSMTSHDHQGDCEDARLGQRIHKAFTDIQVSICTPMLAWLMLCLVWTIFVKMSRLYD